MGKLFLADMSQKRNRERLCAMLYQSPLAVRWQNEADRLGP
jgi:hypothetical protein